MCSKRFILNDGNFQNQLCCSLFEITQLSEIRHSHENYRVGSKSYCGIDGNVQHHINDNSDPLVSLIRSGKI